LRGVRASPRYVTPLAKQQGRQILDGILATYGAYVRVLAKVMPFAAEAPDSPTLVAEAALYAHAQGRFWNFHDAFDQDHPRPGRARIFEVAREIGLDEADLAAALESGRFRAAVMADEPAIEEAGIRDFAFLVDGRVANGSTALAQLIEEAIRKTGHEPPLRPRPEPQKSPGVPGAVRDSDGLLATLRPRQVFALEPRDDAWAKAVEEQLGPLVERDLRTIEPKLLATGIDCRTTMCRVHWRIGKGDSRWLRTFAYGFYSGDTIGTERDLDEHLVVVRRPGETNPNDGVARIKARRATMIYSLRTGRPVNGLRFPVERLPKE
jgi:hypothetical protein